MAGTHDSAKPCKARPAQADMERLLETNRDWAARMKKEDPNFFEALCDQQNPDFLWIGCSDSRVPANQILGLAPGEIFVQRNVGNQAMHTDMNTMSCMEYAVKALKVKSIIVCGHYNCGAVKGALTLPIHSPGLVNCWITDIRACRNQHAAELQSLEGVDQLSKLCELNVQRQVFNVCTSSVVASAWEEGQELHVYGLIYSLKDGLLKKLVGPISATSDYQAQMNDFIEKGITQRCPTTKDLKVSSSPSGNNTNGSGDLKVLVPGTPGSDKPAGMADLDADDDTKATDQSATKDVAAGVKKLAINDDSELESDLYNVALWDRITRHAQWAQPAAAH